jgi:hypothetical protein
VAGLALAAATLALLLVAAWLRASADGHGTHEQLGLAPCAWTLRWNFPCPTCGMTTAFAHAADGDLAAAAATQPFGAALAVFASVSFWGGLHAGLTGANPWRLVRPGHATRTSIIVVSLFLAAWVYKMIVW